MLNKELYFESNPWSWRHAVTLLILIFVLIPIFIEHYLKNFLLISLQNELYAGTLVGLIMSIIFMIFLYLVALKPLNLSWSNVGLRKFSNKYWRSIIFWTLVTIFISILIVIFMEILIGVGTENQKTHSLRANLNFNTFLIGLISAAVISPLYEEIFYRGFLYRFFRSKYGIIGGLLISSIIFMLVHLPTWNTLPVNFLMGLILAWTYEKTNSIWPGVIIHGVVNGIAIILTAIST